jgi:hypothetical protein
MNGALRFVHCWCSSIWRETGTGSEEKDGVRIFAGRLEANEVASMISILIV